MKDHPNSDNGTPLRRPLLREGNNLSQNSNDMEDKDLRERVIRNEQNHSNLKDNFADFKRETHEEFNSLNGKLDTLIDEISGIKATIAKWLGAGGVIVFVGQYVIEYLLKH